jgi:hypothetical protein
VPTPNSILSVSGELQRQEMRIKRWKLLFFEMMFELLRRDFTDPQKVSNGLFMCHFEIDESEL